MYRIHWGLREIPFRSGAEARFYYESRSHEEALARLGDLVDDQRRLGLLLGINGGGKSLLLEIFDRQVRRRGAQVVHLSLLGIDVHELLWCAAADLGANPARDAGEFILWRAVLDCLAANRVLAVETVWLLDDLDDADPAVVETLARLVEAAGEGNTFVLAASQEQLRRLPARLLAQAELRVALTAWEESDTANYLDQSLRQAGGKELPFSAEAIRRLHELSRGVPRQITQLANLALLSGAGRNARKIDAALIDSAWREMITAEAA